MTSSLLCSTGRPRRMREFTMVKMAVLAPIASASVEMATIENPLFFSSVRNPKRMSCSRVSNVNLLAIAIITSNSGASVSRRNALKRHAHHQQPRVYSCAGGTNCSESNTKTVFRFDRRTKRGHDLQKPKRGHECPRSGFNARLQILLDPCVH